MISIQIIKFWNTERIPCSFRMSQQNQTERQRMKMNETALEISNWNPSHNIICKNFMFRNCITYFWCVQFYELFFPFQMWVLSFCFFFLWQFRSTLKRKLSCCCICGGPERRGIREGIFILSLSSKVPLLVVCLSTENFKNFSETSRIIILYAAKTGGNAHQKRNETTNKERGRGRKRKRERGIKC